jgi:hypothetical protein
VAFLQFQKVIDVDGDTFEAAYEVAVEEPNEGVVGGDGVDASWKEALVHPSPYDEPEALDVGAEGLGALVAEDEELVEEVLFSLLLLKRKQRKYLDK